MGKQCVLIVRGVFSGKIIAKEKYNSIKDAKRAFREKYINLCNAEYAIAIDGKKPKYKIF